MTRALVALAHGDPVAAFRLNPRSAIVAPLLVWATAHRSFCRRPQRS